jgi:hypothetical protein
MTTDPLTDAQQAALWRRQCAAYDDLLYAFIASERTRRASAWRRSPRGIWSHLIAPARRAWWGFAPRVWRAFPRLADRLNERENRRREREDPTAVSLGDLVGKRHELSVPRFYSSAGVREEHFRASDPLDPGYVGSLEAEFVRVRREIDGEWA